ncbi:Ig-like domain-containing protein [Agrococcus terreus]|uniref:ATPase AAA n=1 Tax=Agrococcus terreus TaxID=574649 RepID=A0ABQ2KLP9_9MICO|nr:Ig-like domain-containing protein [Agrococcus terreus]GGN86680.1 ATPase AAA [Agrococcus terreus]
MKRGALAAGVGGVLAAGLVVGAVLSPGYAAVEPELDGSSVWVANAAEGAIGLANTANATIERVLRVGGVDEALVAASGTVLVDRDASTVRAVLADAAEPGPAVPIQSGADVQVRGDRVLIASSTTGDVWRTTAGAIAEGGSLGDPLVALGRGGVAALGEETLLAASPGLGRVLRIDDAGETVSSERAPMSPSAPALQLTVLGEDWVLYDAGSGVLSTRSWETPLERSGVRLQAPGGAAPEVVYAADDALVRQGLGIRASEVLASGAAGRPAAPVVAECTYAAWSGGTAWRSCGGEEPAVLALEGVDPQASLEVLQRGSATALVDPAAGEAWAIDRDGARIEGWQLEDDVPEPEAPTDGETIEEEVEASPAPPVAQDDELGARPGAVTLLPVLLNDADPNGDPIVITDVASDRDDAPVSISPDGRTVRLEAPESGAVGVDYRISDGTESAEARATVTVRPDGNEPPVLERPVEATLEAGGTLVLDALDGWVDPDGDPLAVVSATAEAPDRVTVRPDGRLEIRDGRAGAQREVEVTVTDGVDTATAPIALTVHAGTVPISADPITAVARPGQRLRLEPLLAAHGGAGPLSLHNVVAEGLPVDPHYADGTIEVRPTEPGLLRFTYVVTDGSSTMDGAVAVRVLDAADASSAPVTRPQRVLVPEIGSIEVDVDRLATDPAGGIVAISIASSDDPAVRAEVVDADRVRLTLVDELDGETTVRYTATNGRRDATGVLAVSSAATAAVQPPIARDDTAAVRPGGLVEIPVLANDEQPDGLPLQIDGIVGEPEAGLLFVEGDRLRYVAGPEPGTFHATYAVRGPDGQTSTASATIRVADAAVATNAPPEAPTVEARVVAGSTVDVHLPLSDADPNGDPVQLLGPSSAPAFGFVTQTGPATLRYQAGDYAQGTDELRYRIADDLGGVAEGSVRIAVSEPTPALPPVLGADEAEMRPDSSLVVPVLDDDADPAGLPLRVVDAETASAGARATVQDDAVLVEVGPGEREVGVLVTVENSAGSTAASWLRVRVADDAPPPAPDVADVQVGIQAIAAADAVRIDPLAHASVRDGRADALVASLPMEAEGVVLREDGSIEIAVGERTRYVPYAVGRSDDPGAVSTAVIAVPGRADALPQLRPGVAPLTMRSGEVAEVRLADYVDTLDGDGPILTDASEVEATPDSGANPVIDSRTLRFAPPPTYFGPASLTFEVTDGDSPSDPDGRVATIVLPIDVVPGDDVPLSVRGFQVQLEPGEERTIDLERITRTPDPERLARASWSIVEAVPAGFQASIVGSELTVRALDRTPAGTLAGLRLGVRDAAGDGDPGEIVLSVLSSTAPLVAPAPDAVTVQRGQSAEVRPLANDEVSNPFPDTPLRLGGIRAEGAAARGVEARLIDGRLRISVATEAAIGATIVHVQVLDATGDERRGVWSPVTVTVQDRPDPPAPPVQAFDAHEDGVVTMAIDPPAANGSPITGYRIVGPGIDVDCGAQPRCRIEGLQAGVDMRLAAIAVNALGPSEPSAPSEPVHADRLPAAVGGIEAVPARDPGSVEVRWRGVGQPPGGTPVEAYLVHITGAGTDRIVRVGAGERSAVVGGLVAGRAYQVEVAAANAAGVPDASWRWPAAPVPFTAVGLPGTTQVLITDREGGTVTARWAGVDAGGARQVRYQARIVAESEAPGLSCTSGGGGQPSGGTATSATLPVADGARAVVAVTADNGWHCSVSVSQPVFGKPAPVDPSTVEVRAEVRDDARDLRLVTARSPGSGLWIEARVVQSGSGEWARASAGTWLTPAASFQYGRADTRVEVRACAPSGAGSGSVCSDPSTVGSFTPLSLRATVESCRPLQPLEATPPSNASLQAFGSVEARYLVDGSWTAWGSSRDDVPPRASQVQARGVVTYQDPEPYVDPQPTVAGCGL